MLGKQTPHKFPVSTFCEANESPVAMVVQVALLAERLLAERAQHLQSQVLGSVVAVKIPSGEKQFEIFFWRIGKMLTHLGGRGGS